MKTSFEILIEALNLLLKMNPQGFHSVFGQTFNLGMIHTDIKCSLNGDFTLRELLDATYRKAHNEEYSLAFFQHNGRFTEVSSIRVYNASESVSNSPN